MNNLFHIFSITTTYKLLIVILLSIFFSESITAQHSIKIEDLKRQKEVNENLAEQIHIDTREVRDIPLKDIEQKYNSKDFDYAENETLEENGFIRRLLDLIYDFLNKIFNSSLSRKEIDLMRFVYFLIFAVAIFFAVKYIMRHQGRWLLEKSKKNLNISIDEVEKNIHSTNFAKLIASSEQQNDTRQSIRLYYLWLLKVLSDRNIIQWQVEKTNTDYLREIEDVNLKNNFQKLSHLYNYIWYGEFSINDSEYQHVKADFEAYINQKKSS